MAFLAYRFIPAAAIVAALFWRQLRELPAAGWRAGLVMGMFLTGGYVFSVLLQGVNPGAFINGLTILTGLGELIISEVKALLFGVMAGLVGCYRGLTVKGGPKGVGEAVNETVIYAFICLFVINVLMTAIGVRVLN